MPRKRNNRMKSLVLGSLDIDHAYIRHRIWCIHLSIEWSREWTDANVP